MKIRKRIGLILFVLLFLVGCGPSYKYQSGVFEGLGQGFGKNNKDIRLTVTIKDDRIVGVKILDHGESEDIGEKALEELIEQVIENEKEDLEIDNISRATVTSKGFREAIEDALSKAKVNR